MESGFTLAWLKTGTQIVGQYFPDQGSFGIVMFWQWAHHITNGLQPLTKIQGWGHFAFARHPPNCSMFFLHVSGFHFSLFCVTFVTYFMDANQSHIPTRAGDFNESTWKEIRGHAIEWHDRINWLAPDRMVLNLSLILRLLLESLILLAKDCLFAGNT